MFGNEVAMPMFDDGTHGDIVPNDGVFSAIIPASAARSGEMVRYFISASDVNGGHLTLAALHRSGEPSSIPRHRGESKLRHQFDPCDSSFRAAKYFAARSQHQHNRSRFASGQPRVSVYYDGEFYDNIYVSLRGNTTAGYPKKSHRFEFNHEHLFRHPGVGFGWPEKSGPNPPDFLRSRLSGPHLHAAGDELLAL